MLNASTTPNSTKHDGLPGQEQDNKGTGDGQVFRKKEEAIKAITKKLMKEKGYSKEEAKEKATAAVEKAIKEEIESNTYHTGEFDQDFLQVYFKDSFLGTISMEVTKIPDSTMPTAYVGIRPYGKSHDVVMGFNPKFFRSLNSQQRQGVIKHELFHLVFQHIFDRAVGDKDYQTLWNWGTDLAINSIIGEENLPDACLIPGKRPINPKDGKPIVNPYTDFIANAPKLESSDFYFEKLREIKEEQGEDSVSVAIGQGMGTIDDHGKWDELPEDVQEQIRNKIKGTLEKAVEKADRTNDWGNIPQEIAAAIRRIVSREVDWRNVVKNFLGRCRTMDRLSTIRRINKKVPYIFPGYKRKYVATFSCFIDQSGSMSDEDIAQLFGELEAFAQETKLDVFHFDTAVDTNSHTVWARGKPFPPAHRTRCGGTDFQCVADFCNKRENRGKWSGVVILTDGYAPVMGQILGSKVLWVITEHGTKEHVRPGDLVVQMKKEKQFTRY